MIGFKYKLSIDLPCLNTAINLWLVRCVICFPVHGQHCFSVAAIMSSTGRPSSGYNKKTSCIEVRVINWSLYLACEYQSVSAGIITTGTHNITCTLFVIIQEHPKTLWYDFLSIHKNRLFNTEKTITKKTLVLRFSSVNKKTGKKEVETSLLSFSHLTL